MLVYGTFCQFDTSSVFNLLRWLSLWIMDLRSKNIQREICTLSFARLLALHIYSDVNIQRLNILSFFLLWGIPMYRCPGQTFPREYVYFPADIILAAVVLLIQLLSLQSRAFGVTPLGVSHFFGNIFIKLNNHGRTLKLIISYLTFVKLVANILC